MKIEGTTIEQLMGSGKDVSGALRGRIALSGQGETIRQALGGANGRVTIMTLNGGIRATIANVIGQDLGRTIVQAISGKDDLVPLRCLVADFRAQNGLVTPQPMVIDATVSVARGYGAINLRDETVRLTLAGAAKKPSPLRIDDPVHVGGTLHHPSVTVAGLTPSQHIGFSQVFSLVKKSIGGIFKKENKPSVASVDCAVFAARLN
jgi:AsmA family protein